MPQRQPQSDTVRFATADDPQVPRGTWGFVFSGLLLRRKKCIPQSKDFLTPVRFECGNDVDFVEYIPQRDKDQSEVFCFPSVEGLFVDFGACDLLDGQKRVEESGIHFRMDLFQGFYALIVILTRGVAEEREFVNDLSSARRPARQEVTLETSLRFGEKLAEDSWHSFIEDKERCRDGVEEHVVQSYVGGNVNKPINLLALTISPNCKFQRNVCKVHRLFLARIALNKVHKTPLFICPIK